MRKLFNKSRRSIFLSNIIRNILYLWVLILFIIPIICFSQNAYINDFRVNDDNTNRSQGNSRIGVDSSGNFVVAWNDRRNSSANNSSQTYCQIFDKNGSKIGVNFRIGYDTTGIFGLTVLKNGSFICLLRNVINGGFFVELLFQRFDKNGNPINAPTKVTDTIFSSVNLGSGDIASDENGNFIVIWEAYPYASNNDFLNLQRFDSAGNKIGNVITVNDISGNFNITNTKIAINNSGNFVVSWLDRRFNVSQQKYDVFFQRFNNQGEKLGNNVLVNDDNDTTKEQALPWMDVNKFANNQYVITWSDRRSAFNDLNIFFQIYDSNGNKIGNNVRADESNGNPFNSKVALDSNSRFIIGWNEDWYAGRSQYYARRYKANGDTFGLLYMVPQTSPPGSVQSPSDIKIWGDRVYSIWDDTRNGNPDVYCNVRSFQNPDTIIIGINQISNNFPVGYKFYPAYPNPFNPETKVKYSLPKQDDVTLQLFDITGREIMKWIYKDQKKGTYEIKIYNINLSSSVYFLEFKTGKGFRSVQKLILLK